MTSAPPKKRRAFRGAAVALVRWVDTHAGPDIDLPGEERVDWVRVVPFVFLHAACLAVLWVGWSPVAVGVAVALYLIRMFAITEIYHRYFSHRAFRLNRF